MKYTSKQYAQALWEILEEKPLKERKMILNSFIRLLKKQKDFKKISFIEKEFERIHLTKNNLLKAETITPYLLSGAAINKIRKFISSFFNHKINLIILDSKINKNLIGGFQIKTQDILIDASIQSFLKKLNQWMKI